MTIYALGLMSGTSMDGIDIALINPIDQNLVAAEIYPYSHSVEQRLRQVMRGEQFDMHFFARLNRDVGLEFANAARQLMSKQPLIVSENLKVIGMHGQTICHNIQDNDAYTWQIASPYPLFETFAKPVVYDFRSKNVAQGGQGAPLAPIYHQVLFKQYAPVVVINIGGISNISGMTKNASIFGFDIGPGNCLLDAWIHQHHGASFDKDACWAKTGKINHELIEKLLMDPFFHQLPPKSIGKEYFDLNWLKQYISSMPIKPEDVQATLCYLTAVLITKTVESLNDKSVHVFICGGGSKNQMMMAQLKALLANHHVQTTDEVGVSADFLEAMMMAYLAWLRIEKTPLALTDIMGGKNHQFHGIICE